MKPRVPAFVVLACVLVLVACGEQRSGEHYHGAGWCSVTFVDKSNTVIGVAVRKIRDSGFSQNMPDEPPGTSDILAKCAGVLFLCDGTVQDSDLTFYPSRRHPRLDENCP